MKYCQKNAFSCFKIIWLNNRNCTDQVTVLLKSFISLGALLALWCHLWAYFGFFLLATDITVPAKLCSVSWAVLHKKYCSAFYSPPSLSLWKYYLLAHQLWDPFHRCISVQVKEVSLGGPRDLACPSICVYSWTDHYKQECSVWHLCSALYVH